MKHVTLFEVENSQHKWQIGGIVFSTQNHKNNINTLSSAIN